MKARKQSRTERREQKISSKSLSQGRYKHATTHHSGLAILRYLKGVKKVRQWLGFSLAQVGELCGVSPALVCAWQSGKIGTRVIYMPHEAVIILGRLIAQRLSDEYGREVGVWIAVNSPWRIVAGIQCRRCRGWFEFHRASDRLCPDCRAKRRKSKRAGR